MTTLPKSMPRRSTIRWARSGCDVPEKTFMLGILDCILSTLDFSKLFRTKLLARIGLADRTGITQSTNEKKNVWRDYTRRRWMAVSVRFADWEGGRDETRSREGVFVLIGRKRELVLVDFCVASTHNFKFVCVCVETNERTQWKMIKRRARIYKNKTV